MSPQHRPVLPTRRQGQVDPGLRGEEAQLRREDADHRRVHAVHANRATDDAGIAAQPLPPVGIGEDGDVVASGRRLLFAERASQHGTEAEGGEEIGRHAGDVLAPGGAGFADDRGVFAVDGDGGEGADASPSLVVVRDGGAVVEDARLRIGVEHADQAVGVREGQRPEQDAVHDGKYRERRAEAEAEGREGRRGEPG